MLNKEKNKRVIESVDQFYKFNHINSEKYASDQMEAYRENKTYDAQIARADLEEKVGCWIERFNESEREYFFSLFENYNYISENEYKHRIWQLSEAIYEELEEKQIAREEVLFVTVPSPKGVSCGGDQLRSHLLCANLDWGMDKNLIIADIEKMNPGLLGGKKAIVFIDDILGTGFSIRETIENFAEYCGEKNLDDYLIYVTGILITKRAVRYLSKKVRKTKVFQLQGEKNSIKNCMTGGYIFKEEEKRKIEKIIEKYEKEIGIEGEKDFTMGFGKCKILLSFFYNTPNNTLCSFWKCTDKNIPPFPRDKDRRPTLDIIRKRKKRNTDNAYLKGCFDTYENV